MEVERQTVEEIEIERQREREREKQSSTDVLHHDVLDLVHLLLDAPDLVRFRIVREERLSVYSGGGTVTVTNTRKGTFSPHTHTHTLSLSLSSYVCN
jgi:hypothetical protein